MKKLFRYIRYRICRTIYYADHCPIDNRKNYREIAEQAFGAFCLCLVGIAVMFIFCYIGF